MAGVGPGQGPDEERRSTSRYHWDYGPLVACALVAGGRKEENVVLADVSKEGAALIVAREPPESGAGGFLVAANRSTGLTRTLPLTVAQTTAQPDGRHLVGCRFSRPLTFDELSELFFRSW